jgi:hypothetical protein
MDRIREDGVEDRESRIINKSGKKKEVLKKRKMAMGIANKDETSKTTKTLRCDAKGGSQTRLCGIKRRRKGREYFKKKKVPRGNRKHGCAELKAKKKRKRV